MSSEPAGWSSSYCSTSVRACVERSAAIERGRRWGSRRSPKRTMIAIVPTRSGIPTSANSKKPIAPTPASFAASETITLTGDPVSAISDPAWAPNARGMRSCEDGRPRRTESTTTTGRSAATEPLTEMSAVRKATSRSISTISRVRLSPTRAISSCPAHAVTPEASSASLTTNSVAMKITVGSPKPATDWSNPSTPGGPERERDADRDDRDRHAVEDEHRHRRGEHEVRDRDVAHAGPVMPAGRGSRTIGGPGLSHRAPYPCRAPELRDHPCERERAVDDVPPPAGVDLLGGAVAS